MKRALVVALLATALAAPVAHAGCAAVRSSAGWTLTGAPFTPVGVAPTSYQSVYTTRSLASPGFLAASGGAPGRLFSSDGVSIFRTTDGGCAWQRVYTIELTALAASTGDPNGLLMTADQEYRIVDVETPVVTSPGLVYALLAHGGPFTGIAVDGFGLAPMFLARSTDWGQTWRTDLVAAPLPGATVATPVLGDGYFSPPQLRISPADLRTVYLTVSNARDPRAGTTTGTSATGVYVSRDAGATWAFGASVPLGLPVVPDARDALTFYASDGKVVDAVTVAATPVRRRLLALPAATAERVLSIDTTRAQGRPARLVVTTTRYGTTDTFTSYGIYRSLDGGRTWVSSNAPTDSLDLARYFGAWLMPNGDVVVLRSQALVSGQLTLTARWTVTRGWSRVRTVRLPTAAGATASWVVALYPADTVRRRFTVRSAEPHGGAPLPVVGTLDLAAW